MLKVLKLKCGLFSIQKLIMLSIIEKNYYQDRVKFKPTKGKCQKSYRQLQDQIQPCQETHFDSITEELQADYLCRYEGVQVQIH